MDKSQAVAIRESLIAELGLGASPLAVKFDSYLADRIKAAESSPEEIETMKANCMAFVTAAHNEAIARLRDELANDPCKIGYANMTPEQVQQALMTQIPVYVDQVMDKTDRCTGEVIGTETVSVLFTINPPPVGRIWQGIPYARNMPSLDNIAEAKK